MLSRLDTNERVAGATEEEIYAALGLAWIPPELRENGGEIEAAANGTLPKLAELDFVIGSVHSHMNLEASEMTDRLMRALECPSLKMLGHPTGRILLHRESFPFDFDMVATEAARRNILLEINASPERLDLGPSLIRAAKAKGCKFVINTDAHHPKHLANMSYGVRMARRGWLESGHILNTLPLADFTRSIHAR
jgi:DNA polymerase (family 10)